MMLISPPEGPDLNRAEACHGMFRGYLYRLIKASVACMERRINENYARLLAKT